MAWEAENKEKMNKLIPLIADMVGEQYFSLESLGKKYGISADWIMYEYGRQCRALERRREQRLWPMKN